MWRMVVGSVNPHQRKRKNIHNLALRIHISKLLGSIFFCFLCSLLILDPFVWYCQRFQLPYTNLMKINDKNNKTFFTAIRKKWEQDFLSNSDVRCTVRAGFPLVLQLFFNDSFCTNFPFPFYLFISFFCYSWNEWTYLI